MVVVSYGEPIFVQDVEHKEAKKQDSEQALTMQTNDLDGTQKDPMVAVKIGNCHSGNPGPGPHLAAFRKASGPKGPFAGPKGLIHT